MPRVWTLGRGASGTVVSLTTDGPPWPSRGPCIPGPRRRPPPPRGAPSFGSAHLCFPRRRCTGSIRGEVGGGRLLASQERSERISGGGRQDPGATRCRLLLFRRRSGMDLGRGPCSSSGSQPGGGGSRGAQRPARRAAVPPRSSFVGVPGGRSPPARRATMASGTTSFKLGRGCLAR